MPHLTEETLASRTGRTPKSDEAIWDTTQLSLWMGDGSTAGGVGPFTRTGLTSKSVAAGNVTLTDAEAAVSVLVVTGTSGASRNVVVPLVPGKVWMVRNDSNDAVVVKLTASTGVTVATGKSAILFCGAAEIYRVTADT